MPALHRVYILVLSLIVVLALIALIYNGSSYYNTGIEERFFHPDHISLKPSGFLGHGYGIAGSLCMLFGVFLYVARKRLRSWSRLGILKNWLVFHIFLCTLGPLLVLFHTSFKFGGLVAISFWSMVAVFVSGIIGRFIYLQIPRSIEGRELSLGEVRDMRTNISKILGESLSLNEECRQVIVESTKKKVEIIEPNVFKRLIRKFVNNRNKIRNVRSVLKKNSLPKAEISKVIALVHQDISLNRKIDRLVLMQNLFKYWHVAHLPFALVMLIIMLVHVVVTIVFGYRWIF